MNVETKISPQNLLEEWGNFEDWEDGASAAPTGFTLTGTGAAVAQEATEVKQGSYSAELTFGSADAQLYYDHPDFADYLGRKLKLGFWVKTSTANLARLKIDDGVGSSQSSYHTGGGDWEFLTVEHDMDASATRLRSICFVDIAGAAYFDGGILCEGDRLYTFLSGLAEFHISGYQERGGIRQSEYDPARRDGTILGKGLYDKKTLKIEGHVIGSTAEAARDNLDTVKRALLTINELRVDRGMQDLYFADDRYLRGRAANWSNEPIGMQRFINFDFDFIVPEAFARSISRYRHVETIATSPDSFDLTVGGTIFTKPRLYFIADQGGDITSLTLENLTTGQSVSYTGTVSTGDTLVIDCQLETVENDGTDDIDNHVNDFLKLLNMTNKLKFTGSDCTIKIDYYERFL